MERWLGMSAAVSNIVVLRPGALGDVLVTRELLGWLKCVFHHAPITLVAPGKRGLLLKQPGLADAYFDWDDAAVSWLFSTSHSQCPPGRLVPLFPINSLVFAYLDLDPEVAHIFKMRLAQIANPLLVSFSPSRPPYNEHVFIGRWLVRQAAEFCLSHNLIGDAMITAGEKCMIVVPDDKPDTGTLVLHPGSGDRRKNWPLENFRDVTELFFSKNQCLTKAVITSGEADGALGETLSTMLSGAKHIHQPEHASLALLLGNASAYLGNDSGISHLAASVRTVRGHSPRVGIVFGPSNSRIWGQPGACILKGGADFSSLEAAEAYSQLNNWFFKDNR